MDAHPADAPASEKGTPKRWKKWILPGLAFLMALSCLRIPQHSLTTGLDDSWGGVLIYAHDHGLQFGTDIAFTYGPLGIFSVSAFSPDIAFARMLFEVLQAGIVAAGACLLAWRMTTGWRAGFLAATILMAVPIHWGGDDLLVDLGLLFWGLLCWLETGRRLVIFCACLAILAGACALIKFTLLVVGSMTVIAIACDLALRGRRAQAASLVAGFVLVFLFGWSCLGQKFSSLVPFLRNSFAISGGYNLAMGLTGFNWVAGLLVVTCAFAAVVIRVLNTTPAGAGCFNLRRALLLAWLAGLLFLEWKYGFVRADWDHTACFLGFVPVVALAVAALPSVGGRLRCWHCATAIASVVTALVMLHSVAPDFLVKICEQIPARIGRNVGSLLRPLAYVREKTDEYRQERDRSQMPRSRALIGEASVDVFGLNQMFAIFNDFNYRPRPVFQSYSVYSRPLMELNDRFYNSAEAPEFVLFNLAAIDTRFPTLEDALVLRTLLFNYQLAGEEGDFLVLRRNPQAAPPRLIPAGEGDVSAGQAIRLDRYGGSNVWMEISLKPTLLGAARQTLYKPPTVWLGVWSGSETSPAKNFIAPACMLAAGFLASPEQLDDHDVTNLFQGGPVRRPVAYSVELPPGTRIFWQDKIHYRVFVITGKPGG